MYETFCLQTVDVLSILWYNPNILRLFQKIGPAHLYIYIQTYQTIRTNTSTHNLKCAKGTVECILFSDLYLSSSTCDFSVGISKSVSENVFPTFVKRCKSSISPLTNIYMCALTTDCASIEMTKRKIRRKKNIQQLIRKCMERP